MGKARRIIIIGFAGIFVAALVWHLLKPREPSYQGKALSEWLRMVETNGEMKGLFREVLAIRYMSPEDVAIRHIGSNGIPTLLRFVATSQTGFEKLDQKLSEKYSWIPLYIHSAHDLRVHAIAGFYVLGPEGKAAVPELITLLTNADFDVRLTAAFCLGSVGPEAATATPELINELKRDGTNSSCVHIVSDTLGQIGPSARAAVPALTAALTSNPGWARPWVGSALIKLQAASLATSIEQLKDTSNVGNWDDAGLVVGLCATNAEPAIPYLVRALENSNLPVRFIAVSDLGQIHQRPDICVPALVPFLTSENQQLRFSAVAALHQFENAAKVAVPSLIPCLNDKDFWVRHEATNALRAIDPEAAAKFGIK